MLILVQTIHISETIQVFKKNPIIETFIYDRRTCAYTTILSDMFDCFIKMRHSWIRLPFSNLPSHSSQKEKSKKLANRENPIQLYLETLVYMSFPCKESF